MINIREINPAEAPILSAMSDSVNWNVSAAECELLTVAENMRAFFLEADGEIAGSAGMVTYEPASLVFINLVIVKPEFRRRGYATMLIEHILDQTRDYRCKRLHATPEGSKVYAPMGFKPCNTISFFSAEKPCLQAPGDIDVHTMNDEEFTSAVLRDQQSFGFCRENLLKFSRQQNPALALAVSDGHIFGRRWKRFRQMAALDCQDLNSAMALAAAASKIDDSLPQSIITYDCQKDFQQFLLDGNFVKTREMLDMVLGEEPEAPPMNYRAIYGGDLG